MEANETKIADPCNAITKCSREITITVSSSTLYDCEMDSETDRNLRRHSSSSVIIPSPAIVVASAPTLVVIVSTPVSALAPVVRVRRFAHVHSRGGRVRSLSGGEIDADSPSVDVDTVTSLASHAGVVHSFVCYETKSATASWHSETLTWIEYDRN